MEQNKNFIKLINDLPHVPGVYIFKDSDGSILYIGKAKDLKNRVSSYLRKSSLKGDLILSSSTELDWFSTKTELEALLLEAKLIQSHQPPFNVLLKEGQPFVYILLTTGALPQFQVVRNKKKKGTYFGPFIEKGAARKVYNFLINTFKLRLCGKKIENGCLYYHLGTCAGSCRPDFDEKVYRDHVDLAKKVLTQGHKNFLQYLRQQIEFSNQEKSFEKSRELHAYYKAFERVFGMLETAPSAAQNLALKEVWVLMAIKNSPPVLILFTERDNILKRSQLFYLSFTESDEELQQEVIEYFLSYYRSYPVVSTILINVPLSPEQRLLFQSFLQKWQESQHDITIINPTEGYYQRLMRLAIAQAEHELSRQASLGLALKKLLKLPHQPRTIDCFDISHKQGLFLVGSCVRFTDGLPDKDMFRRFNIQTVQGQDDYASLREVVTRRYKDLSQLPDLILIDGGKGQLNAVQHLFPHAEFISLAKREECVFSKRFMDGKILDKDTHAARLLIALRDYTHHFAVTYHRKREQLERFK